LQESPSHRWRWLSKKNTTWWYTLKDEMDNEVSICCFYTVIRICFMLSLSHAHIGYMKKHWLIVCVCVCVCVAFIRSTDTYDVIIRVSSSEDAPVLVPPSSVALVLNQWHGYRSSKPNTCCDLWPREHAEVALWVQVCPSFSGRHSNLFAVHLKYLVCFELIAIGTIYWKINTNKNKRGMQSSQTASFIAISRLLFITMATCERALMRPTHRCDRFVFIGYANVLIQCSLLFTAPETNEVDAVCVFAVCF